MQKQLLQGTDIESTPLGYGCGGLMRILSRKGRQRILDTAFGAGIRHFDVARMYGDGAVERELQDFLSRRRDQVVITTKFGLQFQAPSGIRRLVKQVGRAAVKFFPKLRGDTPPQGSSLQRDFSANAARNSLETSLRELRVDHVDLFLLHEPIFNVIPAEELLEYLEKVRQDGLIRAYGVAGYPDQLSSVCSEIPALSGVIQLPNDPVSQQLEDFRSFSESAFITFSPYANVANRIFTRTSADQALARRWSDAVGRDLSDHSQICQLLMTYSLRANPNGVVLFFSSRGEGIQDAVTARDAGIDDRALAQLTHLIRTEL